MSQIKSKPLQTKQLKEFQEKGFVIKPFPQALRSELMVHIDGHIREIGSSFSRFSSSISLEQIAQTIPDEIWSQKMSRAFRIFPAELANRVHQWANESVLGEFDKTRSAVNVVYPQEAEMNPKLSKDNIAVYWRCVRPGKPDAGRPHRDASFWDLEFKEGYDPKIPFSFNYLKDCIKIWIPLKGCVPSTTLQIIPFSHKMNIPTEVEQTEYGRRPTIAASWLQEHEKDFQSPIELSQGSCLIFDMNLVHRGPRHNNTELRISAELNFIIQ